MEKIQLKSAFRFIPVFIFLAFSESLIFAQTADYFPLQIGNKWLYNWERHNGTITREIIDTLSINNNLYYLMLEEQNSSFWGIDTLFNFYRQDSVNRIWVAHPYTLKETLTTMQFNRAPCLIDSTYDPVNNLTRVTTLQDTNFTVNTPAGTFYHCYYFNSLLVEITLTLLIFTRLILAW